MHFFGCLFALVLGFLFIAIAFVGNIIDIILSILGFKKRIRPSGRYDGFGGQGNGYDDQQSKPSNSRTDESKSTGRQTHKIFEKDDSEYVDFEEINNP